MTDFERFWAAFPIRVGKLAAQKKFTAARKLASLEDILAGVERYKRTKPGYAEWCHPRTWLSQGRWLDEPVSPARNWTFECPHRAHCRTSGECVVLQRTKAS